MSEEHQPAQGNEVKASPEPPTSEPRVASNAAESPVDSKASVSKREDSSVGSNEVSMDQVPKSELEPAESPSPSSEGDEDARRGNFRSKRRFQYRKRECYFKKNNITYIDFKDVDMLGRFIARSGKITPPRFTGTSKPYQRKLAKAIKRARYMGFLPYVDMRG